MTNKKIGLRTQLSWWPHKPTPNKANQINKNKQIKYYIKRLKKEKPK